MKLKAGTTSVDDVVPNTLERAHLSEIRKAFDTFAQTVLTPICVAMEDSHKNQNEDDTDDRCLEDKLNELMGELWPIFKKSNLLPTGVMYYKGNNVELPEDAECIEIVGVKIYPGRIEPVWAITPEKPDELNICGFYLGSLKASNFYLVGLDDDHIVFIHAYKQFADLPPKLTVITSTTEEATQIGSEFNDDTSVKTLLIQRAVAMGYIKPKYRGPVVNAAPTTLSDR